MATRAPRGHWATRLGFVLAAAGSAVGLGNIWKFPYITGMNGGGAFVLVYLACILVVGLPLMWAELLIGKLSERDPVGAMRKLAGKDSPWQVIGWMGVVSAFVILSFYGVVAGWSMAFFVRALVGTFAAGQDPDAIAGVFETLAANPFEQVFWHLLFMVAAIAIVSAGVHRGLERWSEILMPALVLLLVVLFIYVTTLEGFGEGARFLFAPDFSKLTPSGVLEALGHAFFTLSLGMGAMITYGSYLRRDAPIAQVGVQVVVLDTCLALFAGMVIFPVVFHFELAPGAGPGLVFQTLPVAFSRLPGGTLIAAAFFLLLSFAALTSAISLLEVAVASFVDGLGWPRPLAACGVGAGIFVLGIPSAMYGGFFNFMDVLSSHYLLPLGGLGISLYAGWALGRARAVEGFGGNVAERLVGIWLVAVRYLAPVAVLLVFLQKLDLFGD